MKSSWVLPTASFRQILRCFFCGQCGFLFLLDVYVYMSAYIVFIYIYNILYIGIIQETPPMIGGE